MNFEDDELNLVETQEENDPDVDAKSQNLDLFKIAKCASTKLEKDNWVVVIYENQWYPGVITEVDETSVVVNCMSNSSKNKPYCFRWPSHEDNLKYLENEILCQINPPSLINSRDYCIDEKDFKLANKLLLKELNKVNMIQFIHNL